MNRRDRDATLYNHEDRIRELEHLVRKPLPRSRPLTYEQVEADIRLGYAKRTFAENCRSNELLYENLKLKEKVKELERTVQDRTDQLDYAWKRQDELSAQVAALRGGCQHYCCHCNR